MAQFTTFSVNSTIFGALSPSNKMSWGKDDNSRISHFRALMGDVMEDYAGLILVTAASYR